MKWITKRVLLLSNENMYPAISHTLISFIDKAKSEGKIKLWYTSLKNDDGKPSFRIYFQIEDKYEKFILSEFQKYLKVYTDIIGWNGNFHDPDPIFDSDYPHLIEINQACELVLSLTKKFPQTDRRSNKFFIHELRSKLIEILPSIDFSHQIAFRHFVANNLGITDDCLYELILSHRRAFIKTK